MIEIIINHEFRLLIIIINSLVGLMGMGLVAGKMSLDILLASEYPMIQRKEDNSVQCVCVLTTDLYVYGWVSIQWNKHSKMKHDCTETLHSNAII